MGSGEGGAGDDDGGWVDEVVTMMADAVVTSHAGHGRLLKLAVR